MWIQHKMLEIIYIHFGPICNKNMNESGVPFKIDRAVLIVDNVVIKT